MISPIDARQLERWIVKELLPIFPDEDYAMIIPEEYLGLDDVKLKMMLDAHEARLIRKTINNRVTTIWARSTKEQWDELQYLAEMAQVRWPEIQTRTEVLRLLDRLRTEFGPEDESDIAL